jgi:CRP-like cAMP-binding protein
VVSIAKDGQEHVFRLLEHGELFGVPTAVAGVPFPVDIICVNPGQTVEVSRAPFLQFLSYNPSASLAVIANLSHRIGEMFELIETDSLATLPDRVRQRLRQLGAVNGRPDKLGGLRLDFTQLQIAHAVNGSYYRVHIELKALAARGEIELGYGYITLKPSLTGA